MVVLSLGQVGFLVCLATLIDLTPIVYVFLGSVL
jgi:hypothetical protein